MSYTSLRKGKVVRIRWYEGVVENGEQHQKNNKNLYFPDTITFDDLKKRKGWLPRITTKLKR